MHFDTFLTMTETSRALSQEELLSYAKHLERLATIDVSTILHSKDPFTDELIQEFLESFGIDMEGNDKHNEWLNYFVNHHISKVNIYDFTKFLAYYGHENDLFFIITYLIQNNKTNLALDIAKIADEYSVNILHYEGTYQYATKHSLTSNLKALWYDITHLHLKPPTNPTIN
jgi:hypothetical protein